MVMKKFIPSLVTALLFLFNAPSALAITAPDFPTCSNPQGTLKAEYDSGIHGIVGDASEYRGGDKVYQVDEETLMQCFCSEDNEGIQTNWWKVTSLTQEQIDTLKNLGWYYVPNGSIWGLADSAYMARNSEYSCATESSSNSSNNSSTSGGSVLGLASTGNIVTLYAVAGFGLAFTFLGLLLKKRSA